MAVIVEALEAVEVFDFKFVQLRKLNLLSKAAGVPSDPLNLIATSSRYGLIFVGVIDGFRVLKLENILDLNEDKVNFRQAAENYSCHVVHSATPTLIALSSDDMTLAVCIEKDGRVVADMYDVRAFADTENMPVPFLTVQLSSQAVQLQDFMWNPVVIEKYAYCLSDGSLHVHEILDTTLNIVAGLPAQTGATSVCWSPKGKQLVVGKKDGSFSQYKPTLQEVKKIEGPKIAGASVEVLNICWLTTTLFAVVYLPQSNNPDDVVPYVVIVSTPKGADVTYTSFGDVCLGSGNSRKHRYLMNYQAEWGVLICASSNSNETAVIGGLNSDKRNWAQWVIEGEVRADMPHDKKKETYPIGMSLIYCAQRRIIRSETETYSPMPIIFMLATSGLVCPFHVINTKPGCAGNVYPSESICVEGERKAKGGERPVPLLTPSNASSPNLPFRPPLSQGSPVINQHPMPVSTSAPKQKMGWFSGFNGPPLFTNTETRPSMFSGVGGPAPFTRNQLFTPVQQNQGMPAPVIPPRAVRPVAVPDSFVPQMAPRPVFPRHTPLPQAFASSPPAPATMPFMQNSRPQLTPGAVQPLRMPSEAHTSPVLPHTPVSAVIMQPASPVVSSAPVSAVMHSSPAAMPHSPMSSVMQSSPAAMPHSPMSSVMHSTPPTLPLGPSSSVMQSAPSTMPPAPVAVMQPAAPSTMPPAPAEHKGAPAVHTGVPSSTIKDDAYGTLIADVIRNFEQQLCKLKEINGQTLFIGTKDEMTFIRTNSLLVEDFHKDLSDTMQSLNLDTHNLKTASLESFAMLGEASSRNMRRNDPKYMSMLKDRALDPMTAKQMLKRKQLYQYISTQLQEVHDKLDRDRIERNEKRMKKHRNHLRIPSSHAIYQTLVNNHNIIYNLKNHLDILSSNLSRMKHTSTTKSQLIDFSSISAEGELEKLADVLLDDRPSEKTARKRSFGRQKLSPEFQAALREALSNHKITCVRPKVIHDPSESQLLALPILHPGARKVLKENVPSSDAEAMPPELVPATSTSAVVPQKPVVATSKVVANAPLDVKPLSAFTMKPGQPRIVGGITQGTPVARFLVSPAGNENIPNRQFAFAYVPSQSSQRPGRAVPVVLSKENQNQGEPSPVQSPPNARPVFVHVPQGAGFPQGRFYHTFGKTTVPITSIHAGKLMSLQQFPSSSKPIYEEVSPPISPNQSSEDVFIEGPTSPSCSSATPATSPASLSQSPTTLSNTSIISTQGTGLTPSTVWKSDVTITQSPKTVTSTSVLSPPTFAFGMPQSVQNAASAVESPTIFTVFTSKDGSAVVQKNPNGSIQGTTPATVMFSQSGAAVSFSLNSFSTATSGLPSFSQPQKPSEELTLASSQPSSSQAGNSIQPGSSVNHPATGFLNSNENVTATVDEVLNSLALDTVSVEAPLSPLMPDSTETYQPSATTDIKPAKPDSVTTAATVVSVSTAPAATTTASIFGSSSFFGSQPSTSVSSSFGNLTTSSSATATSSFFGQNTTSGGFFGSVPAFATSTTSAATTTTAAPVFGQSAASTFFSQTTTQPSFFGKQSSVFDQASSEPTTTTSSLFSQAADSPFKKTTAVTTTTTSTATSVFNQAALGQAATPTTTTSSVISQATTSPFVQADAPTATTTSSVFNQAPASLFGQAATTTTTTTSSVFNQAVTSPFGQTATPTTTTSSVINQATTSPFGQAAATTTTTTSSVFNQAVTSPFGQAVTATTTTSSVFNQTSPFGQPTSPFTTTTATPFGQTTSPFGQATTAVNSPFGQTANATSPFGQTSSFFGQSNQNATSPFGQKNNQSGGSIFGGQSAASGFTFGKSTFGQSSSNTFGLTKAFFGNSTNQQSGGFSQSPEQPVFGQSSFFSGLGGKPNEQNASKNVFGSVSGAPGTAPNLFGNQGATSFGSKSVSFQTGSFSSSGGSVAQSGFGAFQQGTPKAGGFGSSPSFGSPPTFGGSPSFGSSPTFGAAPAQNVMGKSLFGSTQASFSNFASADAPTFGSLASQSSPVFGAQNQGFGQQPQGNVFGAGGGSVFGGGSSTFGGQPQQQQQQQPPSGFGSPSGGNSSAFTQWRN